MKRKMKILEIACKTALNDNDMKEKEREKKKKR